MGLPTNAPELLAAVARVTGVNAHHGNHVHVFRFSVHSSDGKKCSVTPKVSPKKFYPSNLKQIANCLRVPLDRLEHVLDHWTPADLKEHLESFPAEVLDSLDQLQKFAEHPHLGKFGHAASTATP